MKQAEITARQPLLDKKGRVASRGYSRHLLFEYDAKRVKSLFGLKEWDFYQISNERYVMQLTIGHVSYMASVSATLFDLTTGERRTSGIMRPLPFRSMRMPRDGEQPHQLSYKRKRLSARFSVSDCRRELSFKSDDADIKIALENCSPEKDKMVIATPFSKPRQFYLNYKENCYKVSGIARVGDMSVDFDGAYGLLDWGRGVWPFTQEWFWGNGSCEIDGAPFGFNIGWGFGDTRAATENMFFYNNRAVKLGEVTATPEGEGYMSPVTYSDSEGLFSLRAEPVFDNYTTTKLLFVDNSCHQVFSRYSGFVVVDGKKIEVPPFIAFCEHAKNRW